MVIINEDDDNDSKDLKAYPISNLHSLKAQFQTIKTCPSSLFDRVNHKLAFTDHPAQSSH